MTRALICDPQMPNKTDAAARRRARLHRLQPGVHRPLPPGLPISCIQHPKPAANCTTARCDRPAAQARHGGRRRPAGMKAAAVAAQAGTR
jgi:hypothetical protein